MSNDNYVLHKVKAEFSVPTKSGGIKITEKYFTLRFTQDSNGTWYTNDLGSKITVTDKFIKSLSKIQ